MPSRPVFDHETSQAGRGPDSGETWDPVGPPGPDCGETWDPLAPPGPFLVKPVDPQAPPGRVFLHIESLSAFAPVLGALGSTLGGTDGPHGLMWKKDGATPHDAVHATIDALRDPDRSFHTAHDAEVADAMVAACLLSTSSPAGAITTLGRNCHLPGCFQAPIHALVCAAPAYETAVTNTILQGGCNASRAGFIGACMGAHLGYDAVPSAWRTKFTLWDETLRHAEALAAMRE